MGSTRWRDVVVVSGDDLEDALDDVTDAGDKLEGMRWKKKKRGRQPGLSDLALDMLLSDGNVSPA